MHIFAELFPLVIGVGMALIDCVTFPMVKSIHIGALSSQLMWIPSLLYASQPWILAYSLRFSTMTIMNLLWNVVSNVFITLIGMYWFGELLSTAQKVGVVLSLVSIALLTSN